MPKLMLNLQVKDDGSATMKGFAETTKKAIGEASNYTKRELASLSREAARLTRDMMTPMERHRAEIQKLNQHLTSGRITYETYTRAVAASKAQLNEATNATKQLSKGVMDLDSHANRAAMAWGKMAVAAGAAVGVWRTATGFMETAFDAERVEKAFTRIAGSSAAARREIQFVRDEANRLGFQESALVDPFKRFSAATMGTALAGDPAKAIFSSVAESGATLGLSNEEIAGALQALEQMVSKGKVQAEELRGQLGERLPGAFSLAAKAMGVTTAELDKMLESGKVVAEDLLPKLAEQLKAEYGLSGSADTAASALARLDNAWESLKRTATSGEGTNLIKRAMEDDAAILKWAEQVIQDWDRMSKTEAAKALGGGLWSIIMGNRPKMPTISQLPEGGGMFEDLYSSRSAGADELKAYSNQIEKLGSSIRQYEQAKSEMLQFAMEQRLASIDPSNAEFAALKQQMREAMIAPEALKQDKDYQAAIKELAGDRNELEEQLNDVLKERLDLRQKEVDGAISWQDAYLKDAELAAKEENLRSQIDELEGMIQDVSARWTKALDDNIARARQKYDTLLKQVTDIFYSNPASVQLDTSDALNNLYALEGEWIRLKQMADDYIYSLSALGNMRSQYTIEILGAMSPAKPFSETYRDLMGKLGNIPGGQSYQIDFLMKQGFSSGDAAAITKQLQELQKQASLAYQMRIYIDQHSGVTASIGEQSLAYQYSRQLPKIDARVAAADQSLLDTFSRAYDSRSRSSGGSSGSSYSNSSSGIDIGPIIINYQGSGQARDDVITLADRIDEELSRKFQSNSSRLAVTMKQLGF